MFALVGNPEGQRLYALDPASGQILWGPVSTGTSWRGIVYDRGRIFGINGNGTINAFDAGSGLPVWAVGLFGFPYIFGPIPSTQNGRFYLSAAGAGSYIYDFDSFTGGMVWSRPVDGWLTSPAIGPDALYATFTVQQYYKRSLFNGAVIWHPYPYNTGPGEALSMYYQGKVYTLSDSPWFSPNSIIDSNNGQPLGSFASTIPPAFDQGLSIFVANSGRLEARDATTQSLVWAFDLPGANFSTQPVIINSNLFVGTLTGDLYALDVATGQLRWHGQVGSAIQAYPGAGPDLLVVPAGHTLVAFNSVNGPGFASDHFPGSLLDLGSTSLNLTTTYTLTISNIGRTDLIISNPLLSGPDGGSFSIDEAAYPITIPAGGPSRSLTVRACFKRS